MSNESIYKAFGKAVSTRRKELALTQEQLAGQVKMSRASIANIESGRQNVLLHHVYALAAALSLNKLSDLLPALPQKLGVEPLKIMLSNQAVSNQTLTQSQEAQVVSFIGSVPVPRRGSKVS